MKRAALVAAWLVLALVWASTANVDAYSLTRAERSTADGLASAALDLGRAQTLNPRRFRAFAACIRNGSRVYRPAVFVGRTCRAADGETYYAGLIWRNDRPQLQTGP